MTVLHKSAPRYTIATVTGYGSRVEMTSYSVLDRAYSHREVATFNAQPGRRQLVCAERAHQVCDALNAGAPYPWWDHHGKPHLGPIIEPMRRGNERKFDWLEAARLHREGVSIRRIAAQFAVSNTAVRSALAWVAEQ